MTKKRPFPNWICESCGNKYGTPTAGCSTFHQGECGICGKRAAVTEPRDYNYLPKFRGVKKRKSNPLADYI